MTNAIPDSVHKDTQQLTPQTLPLTGCHLIEASAGTGKTYNITRIYLRLLLERKLDVKNILVMTFTRAATEELRGRIAREIRNALDNWGRFDKGDTFFAALSKQFTREEVYPALHNALLHLDEASIFTIHSFCKRILSQQAFSSGVDFNVQMEADTIDLELEAVRDWYRTLAHKSTANDYANKYELLTQNWPAPDNFHRAFRELLSSTTPVQANTPELIQEKFQQHKSECLQQLQANQSIVFAQLIEPHKQKQARTEEWELLLNWLNSDLFDKSSADSSYAMPKQAAGVFNGTRYGRKPAEIKQQLSVLFAPVKQLKDDAGSIESQIKKAKSYQIAAQGIDIIRCKIAQAKQAARVMNYDDLINQLAGALSKENKGIENEGKENKLAQLIKQQYPVALVDEFQDTDPQQYAILNAVYLNSKNTNSNDIPSALYMIGDPKQAIYAFRSGDVFTYLAARNDADKQWLMDTNWRSSSRMVTAYNRLFYGAPLHDKAKDIFGFDIQYIPVKSADKADKTPLKLSASADTELNAALQFIYFPFNEDYRPGRSKKEEMNQDFCPVIASWCTQKIHHLLTQNTLIGEQALQEQDIAILVRDKKEAAYIQDALRLAGYPSVYLSTHDNVFLSAEASELEQALHGILELENDRLLVAALSTRYLGCDSAQLFAIHEDEALWEEYRDKVFELRDTWLKQGFMAMALKLLHYNFTPEPQHHERSLTNAIQLLELLQQASQQHRQPEQLLNWLREQIEAQGASAEAELRLESDANLIRIITQHGSKGLEYPVVFIPFATRYKDPAKFGNKNIDLFKYHERDTYQLNYFIGQDRSITELYREEAYAETIRLLYVAITRAEHRCYLCVTPFSRFHLSPLGQTLKLSAEDDLQHKLLTMAESEPENIHVQQINETLFPVKREQIAPSEVHYSPAVFSGRIERNWWLSSFSALTRNLRHGGISTPDRDQDELLNTAEGLSAQSVEANPIRFKLTKGAATGNLLHDILEHTDFTQPHWQRCLERPLSRFNETLDSTQQNDIIDWLTACLDTRLGSEPDNNEPDNNGLKLNELSWSQTLRESEFYFPMEQVKPGALGALLAKHRQQRDSLSEKNQPSLIQLPGNQALQGMMHGFIDLIFEWQGKYYIADYKSSHLGEQLDCYQYEALEKNVRDNYYDLQYLLYSLALHRYLKNRLSDYDPQEHFGGIYYLYLRGMSPDSKTGVFNADISPELLDELDELFSASKEINYV
ncbi:MAG: exodeoxyribonuclease V subunit beta [gamma proteobacterium symbiont of Lucinoma myriamae]|nr:exodeoxyribonuclease V subunit beta [gamma proteobacterium symbiont of Lucinoma myriamae]